MRKQFIVSILAATVMSSNAMAFEIGKPITTSVVVTKPNNATSKKQVTLMNIKLSPKERHLLLSYQPKKMLGMKLTHDNLPDAMQLGMNNVPVLDQGSHGSCVTFANTAAVDAAIGKGDYVSQLCNLELGSYLEEKGYGFSGWNGSFGPLVLDQMMRFGIVSKANQMTKSCAGVNIYPIDDWSSEGAPMSLDEFNGMSEDLNDNFYWYQHLNFLQRFDARFANNDEAEHALDKVKHALANGNRLTFGVFLVMSPYCSAGACASYQQKQDTWALTKELETPPYGTGGHEMVITGYDDNAKVVDKEGKAHQGLLTIRNSWGDEVGDHGNYYMTYDYFKKFTGEVQEIVTPKEENQR